MLSSGIIEVDVIRRLDWLDALRGWAVLGVVLVHTEQITHISPGAAYFFCTAGQYGVQLFFFVSALTIGITFTAHSEKYGLGFRASIAWLTKRYFRIAPLYYVAIIFYAVERYVIHRITHGRSGHVPNIPDILANIFFVHSWIPSAINSVVPGGWSIGVEMTFYVLVPFIWHMPGNLVRIKALVFAVLPSLLVSLYSSRVIDEGLGIANNTFFYLWFPTQYPVFAVGLIYYFVMLKAHRASSAHPIACLCAFIAFFVSAVFMGLIWPTSQFVITAPFVVATAFAFLTMGLTGRLKAILVNGISISLGKVSFSIYIIHFFVLDFIKMAAEVLNLSIHSAAMILPLVAFTAAATAMLAVLCKRYVEDPGIALGHRLSSNILPPVVSSHLQT